MYYIEKNISWSRKLNKSFSCFQFDIRFDFTLISTFVFDSNINLALPLVFKVINVKNLHSKNLKY